ncbi:MAG: tyrosine-type recombinase/integrase [Acidobacteriaceae bacterium]|nr:tyrosine-type recombinase/integrase [Acidobacteriaceae bacterium]
MSLCDDNRERKYLTPDEREGFLKAADDAERDVRTFCGCVAYTGCRISEARRLTADRVNLRAGAVIFETLKERRRGVFRAVPVPPLFSTR